MAYEFKKLSGVEALSEVPKNATVLAEVDGSIKRIPSNGLGGNDGSGIKTAIIMSSDYYDALAGVSAVPAAPTFSCINMTFEEAYQTMASGEPLAAFVMINTGGPTSLYGMLGFGGTAMTGEPTIMIGLQLTGLDPLILVWTSSGIAPQ